MRARPFASVLGLAALALIATLVAPAGAVAQTPVPPSSWPETPTGFIVTAEEAKAIADRVPEVAEQTAAEGTLATAVEAKDSFWQVGYVATGKERVQVHVAADDGEVLEVWTGDAVAWRMARGYSGQFGHSLNSPFVWIPLALIFFFTLFDWRRPTRIAHLDLLVLLSFGISHAFFSKPDIGLSVPLVYPPLLYLLGRSLWIGFRGSGSGLNPRLPLVALLTVIVLLTAFRVTLNVVDSGVIDVGYAGVIGADKIADGAPLWGDGEFPENNPFGDTYGPANYYAYVIPEQIFPWEGAWDKLPAAHTAAILFDLATIAGLFVLGRNLRRDDRERGNRLGAILALAWCAYPFTMFASQSNSNDSLISALVIWALVSLQTPFVRGGLVGLAGMAKFAPLALGPLFATAERGLWLLLRPRADDPERGQSLLKRLTPVGIAAAGLVVTVAVMLALPAVDPGLSTFWERTVVSQAERESPFSIWGQEPSLAWLQTTVLALAAAFALLIAFVPRRRTVAQVAALAAASMILIELGLEHWFYLYIPWFAAQFFVAMLPAAELEPSSEPQAP